GAGTSPAVLGVAIDRGHRGKFRRERRGDAGSGHPKSELPRPDKSASTSETTTRSEPRARRFPGRLSSCTTSTPSAVHVPAPGLNVTVYVVLSGLAPPATIRPLPGLRSPEPDPPS